PGGETGRRMGLKIPWEATPVEVRILSRASLQRRRLTDDRQRTASLRDAERIRIDTCHRRRAEVVDLDHRSIKPRGDVDFFHNLSLPTRREGVFDSGAAARSVPYKIPAKPVPVFEGKRTGAHDDDGG